MQLKPLIIAIGIGLVPALASASSHREAPFISTMPTVDATDFYMFTSYEPNRSDYVTFIANYDPLQDAYGGPNYFALNQNAAYDIDIDNNGDAKPDLVFRFQVTNTFKNLAVPAGGSTNTAVPLINIGPISSSDQSALNRIETYTITEYNGDPSRMRGQSLTNASGGSRTFTKPVDNIGNKSIPDYNSYANQYVYNVNIPGCAQQGRVFVGQRKDGFVVNLGEVFDLVNTNPVGPRDGTQNTLHDKNVTSIAMEVPKSCLLASGGSDPVIGGWTTSFLRHASVINSRPRGENNAELVGGSYSQVSRLGAPLVNELVIGLPDKDRFNASQPADDTQFLHYVTNPSLPVLLNVLFGNAAVVPHTPRNDLVAAFLTGVQGLNQPATLTAPGEELRLNTLTAPTAPATQNDLGVLGGDNAGFPNGRRPYDDVVDIELRVAEGALCGAIGNCGDQTSDPNGGKPYTDGARSPGATAATETVTGDENADDTYLASFPYLEAPLPGSPNGSNGLPPDGTVSPFASRSHAAAPSSPKNATQNRRARSSHSRQ
ncbi:MAG: DUF4331 domain-containing protein [Rhodanobacteraceae bacterium]